MGCVHLGASTLTGASLSNNDIAPGATLTWSANADMNVRAAASRTLARPEFRELAPFSFADFAGGYLVVGNPGSGAFEDHQPGSALGVVPAAGSSVLRQRFYKRFADPIEEVVFPSSEFIKSWLNAGDATNIGTEFEMRSDLAFCRKHSRVFPSTSISHSWIRRWRLAVSPRSLSPARARWKSTWSGQERRLQGQSPYVVNAGPLGPTPESGTSMSILFNRFGRRISQVGTQYLESVFEEGRNQLDLVFEPEADIENLREGRGHKSLRCRVPIYPGRRLATGLEPRPRVFAQPNLATSGRPLKTSNPLAGTSRGSHRYGRGWCPGGMRVRPLRPGAWSRTGGR